MNSHVSVKEQLLHILFGTLIFVVLGAIAVFLDLASNWVHGLGVSGFTYTALTYTAHGLMVLDLVLFVLYLATTSFRLCKEMFK